jgi:hypothetical protein
MDQLRYLDFELVIEKAGSEYQARVVRSPAGEATHVFSLPFSNVELENFVLRLGATSRGRRRISSPEMQLARQFGSELFRAVFRGDVRANFVSSQHEAARCGQGLRLKLRLDAPELINMPWEYLYDDSLGRFLSLFEDTPIVRYVDMRGSIAPLRVNPPLSVLVVLSRPKEYEALDVEREKANLEWALSELVEEGMLTVTLLENATLPVLADCLLRGRFHVFHYIGHGGFDERSQDGILVLEDGWGRGHLVSGERMAVLLGNHPTLRLVLLNACEGARTSRDDPFAGTATTLVRTGGVPAVVAMQFAITDEAAITFARGFYTALSVGRPVDAAVSCARLAIFADDNDVEWGTPVLYMRAPDGCIFDVAALTPEMRESLRKAAEAARAEREAAERRAREEHEARLKELHEQAVALLGRRDWTGARKALDGLQELEPGYRDLPLLAQQVRSGLKEQERCAALLRAAQKDLEAGRLPEAIAGFRSVLDLDAGHKGASRQLAEAQARLEQQEAEERARLEAEARQAELARLYAAGEAAAGSADWSQAVELYGQVLKIDDGYEDAIARLDQAREALAGEQARLEQQEAEERARLEAEARHAELTRLFAAAEAAAQAKDWSQAVELYGQVVKIDDGYEDAAARLDQAREALAGEQAERQRQAALAERHEGACQRMGAGDWSEAVRLLSELQEEEPGYRDVEARLAQATSERETEEQLTQLYAEAGDAYGRAAWKRAETLYGQVLALKPGYGEAEARLAEARRQQQLARQYSQAWSHLKARRWQEAIDGFEALAKVEPGYAHPVYGAAADLLAQARQGEEQAELPTPPTVEQRRPTAGPPQPAGSPEETRRREKPTASPEEGKAELPAVPPTRRYRPGELPDAVEPGKKPAARPDAELERQLERRYLAGLSGLEQRYLAGVSAFWMHKWNEACEHFQALVDESPNYKDAVDKLVEAQRQKRWNDLFEQAQSARRTDNWNAVFAALEALVAENPEYRDAADLLAKARQEREQAEPPAPQPGKLKPAAERKPAGGRPKPGGLPEDIRRREKPAEGPREDKGGSPATPAGQPKPTGSRPKPGGLPEEIKRRDKPDDLPS